MIKEVQAVVEDEQFPLITREIARDYLKAMRFLARAYKANQKLHWEEGDSIDAVMEEVNTFLSDQLGRGERKRLEGSSNV
jgi:hypothetical protein